LRGSRSPSRAPCGVPFLSPSLSLRAIVAPAPLFSFILTSPLAPRCHFLPLSVDRDVRLACGVLPLRAPRLPKVEIAVCRSTLAVCWLFAGRCVLCAPDHSDWPAAAEGGQGCVCVCVLCANSCACCLSVWWAQRGDEFRGGVVQCQCSAGLTARNQQRGSGNKDEEKAETDGCGVPAPARAVSFQVPSFALPLSRRGG
jgi:hypothetical protein